MKRNYKILLITSFSVLMTLSGLNLLAKSSFSGERIKKACIDYIYKINGNDTEIAISQNIKDQFFDDEDVVAKCSGNPNSMRGSCFIAVEFKKDGKLLRRIEIPARIKIYADVVITNHAIRKGNIIAESDITISKKDITNYKMEDLKEYEEIIGKRANRNITAGSVITGGLTENDIIIRRGDKIQIVVRSGAVRISSTGRALQDAAVGQTIRIKREGSRSILEGYVAMDGSIIIETN